MLFSGEKSEVTLAKSESVIPAYFTIYYVQLCKKKKAMLQLKTSIFLVVVCKHFQQYIVAFLN